MSGLLVAIPCYGHQMHAECARSVLSIADAFRPSYAEVDFLIVGGESAITRGRSNILPTFLHSTFDTLMFLDADIGIAGEDVLELYRGEHPLRGAAVNLKTLDFSESLSCYAGGRRCTRQRPPPDGTHLLPITGWHEVELLGAAVMMVEREVVERMIAHEPELEYNDPVVGKSSHLFQEIVGLSKVLYSEDYSFCLRAAEVGYSPFVLCDVTVGHWEGRCCWRY